MPEDNMTGEIPHPQPSENQQTQRIDNLFEKDKSPQTEPSIDLPLDDLTKNSGFGLPQIPQRAEAQQRREHEADEKFMQDLKFSQTMRTISDSLITSQLREIEPLRFYNSDEVLEAYRNGDANKKKRVRANMRAHVEARQKTVFSFLVADLRMLYADQGLSDEEVETKIEDISTDKINKKRRGLDQLPKEAQARILENMADERQKNLIENFNQYMYILSFSDPYPFTETTALERQALLDKFAQSSDQEKAAISAKIREQAKIGLRQAFNINLQRLEKIELNSGYRMPLIKQQAWSLRQMFNEASLPQKAGIVSSIQEQKLNLVTNDQLLALRRLRTTLERDVDSPDDTQDEELSHQQKVQDEVDKIIVLAAGAVENPGSRSSLDIEIDETKEKIGNLSIAYENPQLVDTFNLALDLRMSTNDFFKF